MSGMLLARDLDLLVIDIRLFLDQFHIVLVSVTSSALDGKTERQIWLFRIPAGLSGSDLDQLLITSRQIWQIRDSARYTHSEGRIRHKDLGLRRVYHLRILSPVLIGLERFE